VADIEGGKNTIMLGNMLLRRIYGTRRDEVTREWRRLHSEELNDLNFSPKICG